MSPFSPQPTHGQFIKLNNILRVLFYVVYGIHVLSTHFPPRILLAAPPSALTWPPVGSNYDTSLINIRIFRSMLHYSVLNRHHCCQI